MERHRGIQAGDPSAPNHILWIHGYTGSPDAFAGIAQRLSEELNAFVSVPLLPGHGTEEQHLVGHSFDDYLASARHFAAHTAERGKPFAIVGYSFGSFIALLLTHEFQPRALALALPPYRLRFPFYLPAVSWLLSQRPFWHKFMTAEDLAARKGTFYYPDFPGKTISFTKIGKSKTDDILPQITCPILTLNTVDDPLVVPESGKELLERSGHNAQNESHILPHGRHALFFPPHHDDEQTILISFLKKRFQKETAAVQEHRGD